MALTERGGHVNLAQREIEHNKSHLERTKEKLAREKVIASPCLPKIKKCFKIRSSPFPVFLPSVIHSVFLFLNTSYPFFPFSQEQNVKHFAKLESNEQQ